MLVYAPNDVDRLHLPRVVRHMRKHGPPTIRVVWVPGLKAYVALEGSHRLRASKKLGLTPRFVDWSHRRSFRTIQGFGYIEREGSVFYSRVRSVSVALFQRGAEHDPTLGAVHRFAGVVPVRPSERVHP